MPYVVLQTNLVLDASQQQSLLNSLTQQIAVVLEKPEAYMMVVLQPNTCMTLGNSNDPCVHLIIKSIGFVENAINVLSSQLTSVLSTELNIADDRIFIEFCDVPPEKWAWQGKTFA
ncbi:MAG: phenylpyruvate tautomerase MIF-related protein [Thiotrichaceae bacterium]|nr:phenylpyruvate tautomerase MIF-related protein [Thiotrichaceae bacterium]